MNNTQSEMGLPQKKAGKKRSNLPKDSVKILLQWLTIHRYEPYPSEEVKESLAKETNLTLLQVCNWLINARRRILPGIIKRDGKDPKEFRITRPKASTKSHCGSMNSTDFKSSISNNSQNNFNCNANSTETLIGFNYNTDSAHGSNYEAVTSNKNNNKRSNDSSSQLNVFQEKDSVNKDSCNRPYKKMKVDKSEDENIRVTSSDEKKLTQKTGLSAFTSKHSHITQYVNKELMKVDINDPLCFIETLIILFNAAIMEQELSVN